MTDEIFLKKVLKLAKKGKGSTNPNPMVGAVIVKNGKVIGTGYHKKAGLPHAEIEALNSLKSSPKNATLYINLEPCSHFGQTPPCVNTLIKSGIKKVVCASFDPNPKIQGLGIKRLRAEGINVSIGLLEKEARMLNEAFFTFHEKKRPFIVLKFAASLDGKIATYAHDSKWITNQKARNFAHGLRNQYQAVLVGINTIIQDNPHLGSSLRIILDSTLRIPPNSLVLRDNNMLIASTVRADKTKIEKLTKRNIPLLIFNSLKIPLKELIKELTKKEIISVFVEGGSQVLGSFLDEKLVDKVHVFSAPILIGGEQAVSAISGKGVQNITDAIRLTHVTHQKIGDSLLTTGLVS